MAIKLTRIFLIFSFFCQFAKGQSNFVEVKGLPTKEVFDLLVDKKGFLWIGHNLGISRYDGVSFTHFSHPMQSALSMTDLIEDPQGRIWCHNFNSQIFYIENERMNLLKDYDYSKEATFPRMVLLNDELVVTSSRGLFVCNTRTFKSKYLRINDKDTSETRAVGILNDKVIALGLERWYMYDQQNGFRRIKLITDQKINMYSASYFFAADSYNDTLYLGLNPKGTLYKIIYSGSSICVAGIMAQKKFINTLSIDNGTLWVNSRDRSNTIDGSIRLDFNASDHTTDHQGNHWVSTLDRGLFVSFRATTWKKVNFIENKNGDFVRNLAVYKQHLILCTNKGEIIFKNIKTGTTDWRYTMSVENGGVEFIKEVKDGLFLFSSNVKFFSLDAQKRKVHFLAEFPARDADVFGTDLLVTSPMGFYMINMPDQKVDLSKWSRHRKKMFPLFERDRFDRFLVVKNRSKAVRYNNFTKTIYVSLQGKLWEIDSLTAKQIEFNGSLINSTALEYHNNTMYIATLNGLLLKESNKVSLMTLSAGLSSNIILNMKRTGNYLWLFLNNAIQVLDLNKNRIIEGIDLPQIPGSNIYDVVQVNDTAYLTAEEGVYMVSLKHQPKQAYKTYLTSVMVNNRDTLLAGQFVLPYNKNNIQFNLAVPWYHPSHNLHFRYRLKGENQSGVWYTTNEHEKNIRFAALMPGKYEFESYAVIAGNQEDLPLVIRFEIEKPWWKQWWFISIMILLSVSAFYVLYRMRLQQLLKVEKIRRNISSDLHDEIGSTLSSINIYSELAKKEEDNEEYLGLIQDNVREVVTKLDDLVWSINPRNDSFKQLISRMQLFAEPLLFNSNIHYSFDYDSELLKLDLSVDIKQNLYLLFKETINNAVKHSKAKRCITKLRYKKKYVHMYIEDDGIGFTSLEYQRERNGLKNMQERAKQMKAVLKISSAPKKGTAIHLRVPIA